jgi:hypothetical protein
MGAVYRVVDTFIGEVIALKLATVERDHSRRANALWALQRREVAMARRVTHPNVARVFDLGKHDGVPYITMAYVPGRTLRATLDEGALDVVDIVRISHHIASALTAAHAAGVLHLDLKPENIVLTGGPLPSAVLVDFGIARSLGSPGTGMGTADYLAPEQLDKVPLTGAADVFALGCVLHVALSGQNTFAGRNGYERMMARLHGDPLPLPKSVPAPLANLVSSCLARAAAERPTAAALERAFADQLARLNPNSFPDEPSAAAPSTNAHTDLGAFAGGLGRRVAVARGKILVLGSEEEALADLDAVLAIAPKLDAALAVRALALIRVWNRSHVRSADERHELADLAAQAVADAVAHAPHLADTHLADALIADYAGDVGYAVRALHRAHAREPLHAFSHEVLGRIELEADVGDVDRLLLAHELDPRHYGALMFAAREYFLRGNDTEALALIARYDAEHRGPNFEARTLRMRVCLWRRDRDAARTLLAFNADRRVSGIPFLVDAVAAVDGAFSALELVERAAATVEQTTTPKRRCFAHQLAVEGLAVLAPDEAIRHLISAARLPLADLRWLDACPAHEPLRGSLAFIEARQVVVERVNRAFTGFSANPDTIVTLPSEQQPAVDMPPGHPPTATLLSPSGPPRDFNQNPLPAPTKSSRTQAKTRRN